MAKWSLLAPTVGSNHSVHFYCMDRSQNATKDTCGCEELNFTHRRVLPVNLPLRGLQHSWQVSIVRFFFHSLFTWQNVLILPCLSSNVSFYTRVSQCFSVRLYEVQIARQPIAEEKYSGYVVLCDLLVNDPCFHSRRWYKLSDMVSLQLVMNHN